MPTYVYMYIKVWCIEENKFSSIKWYNYISDDKDYVDPFNPPELDVNDAFNEYNNYDDNNQQNNRDYSNNYEDGNNDNVDYSSDYNGAPAETDNFPDYGPQQTIEANTRVEQNNNKQVRI